MVHLSLREAVKHFDVSRPTLQKALKSGKISGSQSDQGYWTIDPAELARIYQPRKVSLESSSPMGEEIFTTKNTSSITEIDALRAQLVEAEQRAAVAEALAQERAERIIDLRRMLPTTNQQKKRRWWSWRSP